MFFYFFKIFLFIFVKLFLIINNESFNYFIFFIITNLFAQDKLNEPDVNAFIEADVDAMPKNLLDLRKYIGYPAEAREKNITGKVVVRVLVDTLGNYVKHVLIKTPDTILSNAVTAHISKIKFTPASNKNKLIMKWVNIPFDFKIVTNEDEKKKKKSKK